MKKIFTILLLLPCLFLHAQKNRLLEPSFWQESPDLGAIKTEINKGSSPSQLNRMSMDPVAMAINGQAPFESIEYLLSQPGNQVDKLTHDGRTYLHLAASRGNVQVMELLLKKGAKANVQDSHGSTPLTFAAGGGQQNTRIYDLLIASGVDLKKEVNPEGANVLLLAIANDKSFALTDYFISKGLSMNSVDASGINAFGYAAKAGNIELLKAVMQKGVKPDQNAMLMAVQGGGRRGGVSAGLSFYQYLESVNVKTASTTKAGENVLHFLVRKQGQNDIIQYFLAKGVNVNQADEDGNTVFMNAALANRDSTVVSLLLPYVKDINLRNQKGISALAMAVRGNSPELVSFLISKGADVETLDKEGNNLAYYVIESYRPALNNGFGGQGPMAGEGNRPANGPRPDDLETKFAILQKAGLVVGAPQANGNTLYHLAILKNDVTLLKRLQPFNVDVNFKNKEGLTALHKAALIAKDDTILQYLLSIGANKDLVTTYKETAFDLATENESLTKNNISINFLK